LKPPNKVIYDSVLLLMPEVSGATFLVMKMLPCLSNSELPIKGTVLLIESNGGCIYSGFFLAFEYGMLSTFRIDVALEFELAVA